MIAARFLRFFWKFFQSVKSVRQVSGRMVIETTASDRNMSRTNAETEKLIRRARQGLVAHWGNFWGNIASICGRLPKDTFSGDL